MLAAPYLLTQKRTQVILMTSRKVVKILVGKAGFIHEKSIGFTDRLR